MGRRERQRRREGRAEAAPRAPSTDYTDAEGNVLTLRGAMTAATRRAYATVAAGAPLSREDAWQRSVEFLFERLAERWVIAGAALQSQRELLARYRVASPDERRWVRDALREHLAANFPELEAP